MPVQLQARKEWKECAAGMETAPIHHVLCARGLVWKWRCNAPQNGWGFQLMFIDGSLAVWHYRLDSGLTYRSLACTVMERLAPSVHGIVHPIELWTPVFPSADGVKKEVRVCEIGFPAI